ncbi:hypothetical protein Dsin_009176 [Dipteronia sinensis]|uniref:CCHC-type domain-containing protein n=1 Tax=Dipteronia sinensis TaxID=43782 RepID=A0AAE0AQ41_9ROSI|nr:hypothetical protein Dsin_009176 [Dipteronia sinensis]
MDVCRVIIRFNGYWEDDKYVGGESRGLVRPKGLTYHDLVSLCPPTVPLSRSPGVVPREFGTIGFPILDEEHMIHVHDSPTLDDRDNNTGDGVDSRDHVETGVDYNKGWLNNYEAEQPIITALSQWELPGADLYSFDNVTTIVSLTSSGPIFTGQMFRTKEDLKKLMAPKVNWNGPIIRPLDIIEDMRGEHDIQVLYTKAWRATQNAKHCVFGKPSESFQLMPSYLYMLEHANPDTVTKVKKNSENKFMYSFMCLGACIEGFRMAIRPVIAIDGTHLKGSCKGVVFVATCKDGNNKIFPLAFAIGDKENEESWTWFLTELHKAIGHTDNLMFISDGNPSIPKSASKAFPNASHGLCIFHITQNLKSNYKKTFTKDICDIFTATTYTYRQSDYEKEMIELFIMHPKVHQYVLEIGPEKWACAHSREKQFDTMTTNIVENLSNCMKFAWRLLVTMVLEFLRDMMQMWFHERHSKAKDWTTQLSEWATKIATKRSSDSLSYNVQPIDLTINNVKDGGKNVVVDMQNKTCSCQCIRHSYAPPINPIGCPSTWVVPEYVKSRIVIKPDEVKHARRLKVSRAPSSEKVPNQNNCSQCGAVGHLGVNCPNPPPSQDTSTSVTKTLELVRNENVTYVE